MEIENAEDYHFAPDLMVMKYKGFAINKIAPGLYYYRKAVGARIRMGMTDELNLSDKEAILSAIAEIDRLEETE